MHELTENANALLGRIVSTEQNWVTKTIIKLFK